MAAVDEAQAALLEKIAELVRGEGITPMDVLFLAEAFAWAVSPSQSHGATPSEKQR